MNKLEHYLELDKIKRQLEIAHKMNAPKSVIDFANTKIDSLTKVLGLKEREPSLSEMIIYAYCKEEFKNKIANYLKTFLGSNSFSLDKLNICLNSSYQNVYDSNSSENVKLKDNRIEWAEYLKIGRFKDVSEDNYKKELLNIWATKVYQLEKDSTSHTTKENSKIVIDWIKEQIDNKPNNENKLLEINSKNIYSDLFIGEDNTVFLFFEALKDTIVNPEKPYAGYSFIYREMYSHKLFQPPITVKYFKKFLKKEYGVHIARNSWEYRPSQVNSDWFDLFYKKFQLENILGKPKTRF